jgi:hypothetical protein
MKTPIHTLLICAAILLFLGAGIAGPWNAPSDWPFRGRLIAWGLFCWSLSEIVSA